MTTHVPARHTTQQRHPAAEAVLWVVWLLATPYALTVHYGCAALVRLTQPHRRPALVIAACAVVVIITALLGAAQ